MSAAAGLAAGPQADQLPGQGRHRLRIHPLIDRLVRHPTSLIVGIVGGQPARDRRRRPSSAQLPAHHRPQPRRPLHHEQFRPTPSSARRLIGSGGPVPHTAAVSSHVTRDHRRMTPHPQPDLFVLQTLGQATGNLFPLRQHQHLPHGGHPVPSNHQDQMLRPAEPKTRSSRARWPSRSLRQWRSMCH